MLRRHGFCDLRDILIPVFDLLFFLQAVVEGMSVLDDGWRERGFFRWTTNFLINELMPRLSSRKVSLPSSSSTKPLFEFAPIFFLCFFAPCPYFIPPNFSNHHIALRRSAAYSSFTASRLWLQSVDAGFARVCVFPAFSHSFRSVCLRVIVSMFFMSAFVFLRVCTDFF